MLEYLFNLSIIAPSVEFNLFYLLFGILAGKVNNLMWGAIGSALSMMILVFNILYVIPDCKLLPMLIIGVTNGILWGGITDRYSLTTRVLSMISLIAVPIMIITIYHNNVG